MKAEICTTMVMEVRNRRSDGSYGGGNEVAEVVRAEGGAFGWSIVDVQAKVERE